jgi:hypothetical protein
MLLATGELLGRFAKRRFLVDMQVVGVDFLLASQ